MRYKLNIGSEGDNNVININHYFPQLPIFKSNVVFESAPKALASEFVLNQCVDSTFSRAAGRC
jgi:hypothetical protein